MNYIHNCNQYVTVFGPNRVIEPNAYEYIEEPSIEPTEYIYLPTEYPSVSHIDSYILTGDNPIYDKEIIYIVSGVAGGIFLFLLLYLYKIYEINRRKIRNPANNISTVQIDNVADIENKADEYNSPF